MRTSLIRLKGKRGGRRYVIQYGICNGSAHMKGGKVGEWGRKSRRGGGANAKLNLA